MRNGKNILRMQADEEDVYHLMDLRERYFLMIGFGSFIEGINRWKRASRCIPAGIGF